MSTKRAKIEDAKILSSIISESNKDVANEFGLNINNAAKHPSFCTKEWVISDFEKGEEYFLYFKDNLPVGCVAFENPRAGVAYLNRLCVLREFRHHNIGKELVWFIFDYAKRKDIKRLSIGIIAKNTRLKNWYLNLGFKEGDTKTFFYLPFDVLFMNHIF
ncbi:GNAT family N-acetyltransferase [Halarcobacter anaerophilus]|uniref:GNAT family N-acetyltransferase n=1 Tax=Halarcobacter anaerophilus TaxID=877500 RepID=UPI0005C937EB|nr:GNAT family N-acetyltransferase [Halarcobacter anaerophilus]